MTVCETLKLCTHIIHTTLLPSPTLWWCVSDHDGVVWDSGSQDASAPSYGPFATSTHTQEASTSGFFVVFFCPA